MPWPEEIQEAENRMNAAKAAVLADMENGLAYNVARRNALVAALIKAQAEFVAMVAGLHQ
jgi:hypothetical protein